MVCGTSWLGRTSVPNFPAEVAGEGRGSPLKFSGPPAAAGSWILGGGREPRARPRAPASRRLQARVRLAQPPRQGARVRGGPRRREARGRGANPFPWSGGRGRGCRRPWVLMFTAIRGLLPGWPVGACIPGSFTNPRGPRHASQYTDTHARGFPHAHTPPPMCALLTYAHTCTRHP